MSRTGLNAAAALAVETDATAVATRRTPSVTLAVATYRRPRMLQALLLSIARLKTPAHLFRLKAVVIIDNDAARSACETVEQLRDDFPCDLIYDCAPRRNIADARNLGVRRALETSSDYIAFTDDDCVVSETWLAELVTTALAYRADVVWGLLAPKYAPGMPPWVIDGAFFRHPTPATGSLMRTAESNNVLVHAHLLQVLAQPFDPAFGVSGGSDSLLFMRVHNAGARIVRCANAIVTEVVPRHRGTTSWLLQRSFRIGNAGVHVYRAALPVSRWLPDRAVAGTAHIALGLLSLVPALLLGRIKRVRSLRRIALGAGIFTALFGYKYLEYLHPAGE